MTDLEISKALALAIGWKPEQMRENRLRKGELLVQSDDEYFARPFSYADWNVIGPIAARYDCFPMNVDAGWCSSNLQHAVAYADTPQKAIAMAVIEGAKK